MHRSIVFALILVGGCIEGPEPLVLHQHLPVACETGLASATVFRFTLDGDNLLEYEEKLRANPPVFRLQTESGDELSHTLSIDFPTIELRPDQLLPADTRFDVSVVDLAALSKVHIPDQFFPLSYSTQNETRVRSWVVNEGTMFVSFSQPLDPASVAFGAFESSVPIESFQWLPNSENTLHLQFATQSGPAELSLQPSLRTPDGLPVFEVAEQIAVPDLTHSYLGAAPGECLNL